MKRFQIINMFRILGRVKLNKIEDKNLRNALISNHLKMFRVAKENDEYIVSLRNQFDADATAALNEAYDIYANEEIDVPLEKINREAFADVIAASNIEFTLGDFVLLDAILED